MSKIKFINGLEKLNEQFDIIDKETQWTDTEPQWWLDMLDFRQKADRIIQRYKSQKQKDSFCLHCGTILLDSYNISEGYCDKCL